MNTPDQNNVITLGIVFTNAHTNKSFFLLLVLGWYHFSHSVNTTSRYINIKLWSLLKDQRSANINRLNSSVALIKRFCWVKGLFFIHLQTKINRTNIACNETKKLYFHSDDNCKLVAQQERLCGKKNIIIDIFVFTQLKNHLYQCMNTPLIIDYAIGSYENTVKGVNLGLAVCIFIYLCFTLD